jgi:hypothetical protein
MNGRVILFVVFLNSVVAPLSAWVTVCFASDRSAAGRRDAKCPRRPCTGFPRKTYGRRRRRRPRGPDDRDEHHINRPAITGR